MAIKQQISGWVEPRAQGIFIHKCYSLFPNDVWTAFTLTSSCACISLMQEIFNSVPPKPSHVFPGVKWGVVLQWGWRWSCRMRHWQGRSMKAFFLITLYWQPDQESLPVFSENRWPVFSCCPRSWTNRMFLLPFLVIETSLQPFVVRALAGDAPLKPPFPISLPWIQGLLFLARGFQSHKKNDPPRWS